MSSSRSVHPLWVVIPLLLAPSAVWIARDHSVWPWDQAWYAQVAVQSWHGLTHSFREWATVVLTGLNAKPPGIVWLGELFVPLHHIVGTVENALLLSILLTEAVLLGLVYRIGRILSPTSNLPALAGVTFTAATQGFVGLSEQFFVEPLQAVAVAWTAWIALESRTWPAARILLHLTGAVLLGILAKATTPVYCFVFCLYAVAGIARKPFRLDFAREWKVPSSRWLILAIGAAVPPTGLWYYLNFKEVLEHVRISSSGDIALRYGFRAPVWQKLLVWLHFVHESFLAPFLLWALIAGAAGAIVFGVRGAGWPKAARVAILLSVVQTAAVLLLFSINDTVDARYLFAIIINVAAVFMAVCSMIQHRPAIVLLLLVCGAQWVAVHRFALGDKDLLRESVWLPSPHSDRSEYDELTRVIERIAVAPQRYNIVGVEEAWFNANSAAFFAAKHQLDTNVLTYYTSLGYAATDPAAAFQRVKAIPTHFFTTLDESSQVSPPTFLNVVSLPVLRQVRQDPDFAQVPFESRKGVVIFESRLPPLP